MLCDRVMCYRSRKLLCVLATPLCVLCPDLETTSFLAQHFKRKECVDMAIFYSLLSDTPSHVPGLEGSVPCWPWCYDAL
jgi:hypothetical protein